MDQHTTLNMAVGIVTAYVSNNPLPVPDLASFIRTVHGALANVKGATAAQPAALKPAVPVHKSVFPDYLICLEDGKRLKMLKRYLRTHFGLSPQQYRVKWGLAADYPMVSPNYARERSAFARKIGLGVTPGGRGKRQ